MNATKLLKIFLLCTVLGATLATSWYIIDRVKREFEESFR